MFKYTIIIYNLIKNKFVISNNVRYVLFLINKIIILFIMYKIKINKDNNKNEFKCPMTSIIIKERGEINFGMCRICKYNILGQIIDNYIYCGFGSSSGGGGGTSPSNPDSGSDNQQLDPDNVWEDYNG